MGSLPKREPRTQKAGSWGRLSDAPPSHGVEVAAVARQLSEVRIKHNRRRTILSVVCVVRGPVRIEHGGAAVVQRIYFLAGPGCLLIVHDRLPFQNDQSGSI